MNTGPAPRGVLRAGEEPVRTGFHAGQEPGADLTSVLRVLAPGTGSGARNALSPLHLAFAVIGAAFLWVACTPVDDVDSVWHVRVGREILARHTLHGLGTSWLAVRPPSGWLTSQWASEVSMSLIVTAGGWRALIAARLALLVAILAGLAVTLLRGRPALLAVPVAALTAFVVLPSAQDRPQTVSLLFLAALGPLAVRLWTSGERPPLMVIAIGSLLWAQFHGLWILAPAAFLLVAVGKVLDGARWPDPGLRDCLRVLGCSLAGVINPHGIGSFLLPLQLSVSTAHIAEWQPTTLASPYTVALATLIGLHVTAWARSGVRVPRSELMWVACWTAFALLALRNLAPAALMIAPATLAAMDRTWGATIRESSARTSVRERRVLSGLILATVAAGLIVAAGRVARLDPLSDLPARSIGQWVGRQGHPLRIFNAYNAASGLIEFGKGNPRLIVDGRADLWGEAYVSRIIQAENLGPGWQQTLDNFRPEAIVLPRTAPLTQLLLQQGSWRLEIADSGYVLLVPDVE